MYQSRCLRSLHYAILPSYTAFSTIGPIFLHQSGQPLTHRTLSAGIKAVCSRLGLDPQSFTPHSLRAGSATDTATANLPDTVIQRLGCWRSQAYSTYVRPSPGSFTSLLTNLPSHSPLFNCLNSSCFWEIRSAVSMAIYKSKLYIYVLCLSSVSVSVVYLCVHLFLV